MQEWMLHNTYMHTLNLTLDTIVAWREAVMHCILAHATEM